MHIFHIILGAVLALTGTAAGVADSVAAAPVAAVNTAVVRTAAVHYVALGDSYSSGVGAGSYISASGNCERSTDAYPEQWAGSHSPASFVSVACSGATTADVLSSQVSALSTSTTLVSITIGGNDAGFSSVMETCVLESTSSCLNAVEIAGALVERGAVRSAQSDAATGLRQVVQVRVAEHDDFRGGRVVLNGPQGRVEPGRQLVGDVGLGGGHGLQA